MTAPPPPLTTAGCPFLQVAHNLAVARYYADVGKGKAKSLAELRDGLVKARSVVSFRIGPPAFGAPLAHAARRFVLFSARASP